MDFPLPPLLTRGYFSVLGIGRSISNHWFFTHQKWPKAAVSGACILAHDHMSFTHVYIYIYGLVFFSRGPRYVLVGGGALAKHTPEAYPEANPQNEDHF